MVGEGVTSVLIIEEDSEWAGLMAQVFNSRKEEWFAQTVGTMAEAITCIEARPWDLLISDLDLPDSHGLGTLYELLNESPDSGIVVMTGEAEESQARLAIRAGAQDYLVKGFITPPAIMRVARYAHERAQLDLQLRNSRQLLVSTLDALPAYVAILDEDGRIRATNAKWMRYDNPSDPLIHACTIGTNYLAACDRARGAGGRIAAVASGVLQVTIGLKDRFTDDYCVPAFSGQSWYEISANRFRDKAGKATVVISQIDISERKELEARLRISEELFSIISNNVVDLMAIIDADGHRIYTSPSYWMALGYSEEEMRNFSSSDLLHPEDVDRVVATLKALFEGQTSNSLEYRLRHREGHYLHFESRGCLIQGKGPGPARALVVARNVTERKIAEGEKAHMESLLRQAQKLEAIGQLAAGIAHEINTPTQYIGDNTVFLRDATQDLCALVERLSSALEEPSERSRQRMADLLRELDFSYLKEEIPRAIQQSMEGVGRVTKIVSAMKDFGRPSGESKEFIDLNRAIESTATVSRNEWKFNAEMEMDLDPDLPPVPCFPGEFNQVVLNILVNAAHAIDEVRQAKGLVTLGTIRVTTRRTDFGVEIRIADTGTGIPEINRERIFEPFFTTKPVGKGTGQGLSLAHAVIVDKHGGHLSLESEMGLGSTFIIELPLQTQEGA